MRQTKLTKSARGEHCTLQLHPYCNGDPETVVLCHLPTLAGIGMKSPDIFAVYGCSSCHDIIDGRDMKAIEELGAEEVLACKLRALFMTHQRMIEKGLIHVAGQ